MLYRQQPDLKTICLGGGGGKKVERVGILGIKPVKFELC